MPSHPAAQGDLDEIFDYTVRQWGLEQAVRYMAEFEYAFAALAAEPGQATDSSDIRVGYRRAIVGRHAIYLRAENYGISVVRILNQRMGAPRYL